MATDSSTAVPEADLRLRSANRSSERPGFSEGWFQVAYSDELAPGAVLSLRYFGRDLVLFRTEGGRAQVLDAYCAHLGAHLGVGGVVTGDRLRCPFHAWEYGVDGACKAVPYSPKLPQAAVASWPTEEKAGLVFMWYSPSASPPKWPPPDMPEYGSDDWRGYRRSRFTVRTTTQEVIENIFDVAHGQYVHGNALGQALPVANFRFADHTAIAELEIDLPSVGAATSNTVVCYGLGISISRSVGIGSKTLWATNTPIDADHIDVRFSVLTAASTPRDPDGQISIHSADATILEFSKDIPIWENKIYRSDPTLCVGDGPIGRFRLWAQQFQPG